MDEISKKKIYKFIDARTVPDPIPEYNTDFDGIPIIIDNGM